MPADPKAFQAARDLVEAAGSILVIPHANVDPDGLSAALACYLLFTAKGKNCTVLCPDTPPSSLEFLPGYKKLEQTLKTSQDFIITLDCSHGLELDKLRYSIEENKVNIVVTPKQGAFSGQDITFQEGKFPYDLIIIVDTAELSLLGSLYQKHAQFFQKVPILNIDHHISNTQYGTLPFVDAEAASATEVLYAWFTTWQDWKSQITPDIATLLLTGLITDTRSFQNPNTTPRSLEVAAELLDLGARQQEIIKFIYKTKPLSTLKIWGRALNRIQVNAKERIVWSLISREDLEEMHSESKETHGIIDELLTTVPDADIYILFTEVEEGGFKASLRTSDAIDSSTLTAKLFGGGGHARAAGFRVQSYDNFQLKVLECIQKILAEIHGSPTPPPQEIPRRGKQSEDSIDIVHTITDV